MDDAALSKIVSDEGFISKTDFIKLGQDLKLLDFGGPMGEKRKIATSKKEKKFGEADENVTNTKQTAKNWKKYYFSLMDFTGFVAVYIQGKENESQ